MVALECRQGTTPSAQHGRLNNYLLDTFLWEAYNAGTNGFLRNSYGKFTSRFGRTYFEDRESLRRLKLFNCGLLSSICYIIN